MRTWIWSMSACLLLAGFSPAIADGPAEKPHPKLAEVFPPPEDQGGWKTFLPESGIPDASQKAEIRKQAGIDWDKLAKAWEYNAEAPGNTGFMVIRHGVIVGRVVSRGRPEVGTTTSTPARRPTPAPPSA